MSETEKERALRELREAADRVKNETGEDPPAPANPALEDSQARGGAEMATPEGRQTEK